MTTRFESERSRQYDLDAGPVPFPATHPGCRRLLLTDFDGTLTEREFFACAMDFLPPDVGRFWRMYREGKLTHFQALQSVFALLPGDESVIREIAERTHLDANFGAAVERLRAAGWDVLIVSAGCEWYIRHLLRQSRVDVPVIANPGSVGPAAGPHGDARRTAAGLRMTPREGSPFGCVEYGVDKESVVRHAMSAFEDVAFAGNSQTDLAPARLVPPDRRFARGWLGEALATGHQYYRAFEHWSDIPGLLLGADDRVAYRRDG